LCTKLTDCDIPRIITHKGKRKHMSDVEDIMKFVALLDEHKYEGTMFIAANLIDLYFMLQSIVEIKK
jgi:hypothetical protein